MIHKSLTQSPSHCSHNLLHHLCHQHARLSPRDGIEGMNDAGAAKAIHLSARGLA